VYLIALTLFNDISLTYKKKKKKKKKERKKESISWGIARIKWKSVHEENIALLCFSTFPRDIVLPKISHL
jgi:hypothetical protein